MNESLPTTIRVARTVDDFRAFAALVTEYVAWSRDRYQDDVDFIDRVFGHQSLAAEIDQLSIAYAPPNGNTFLAVRDGQVLGGGAYRRLADGTCEMKRLFVPSRFKGRGVGRRLCTAIIGAARDEGFALMRLDTGDRLREAIALYESLGFYRCAPHRDYPDELMRHLLFMERPLAASEAGGTRAADPPQKVE